MVWVKALRSFSLGRDSAIERRSSVGNKVNRDMVYLYPSCGGLCAYFGGADMVGDQRLTSLALGGGLSAVGASGLQGWGRLITYRMGFADLLHWGLWDGIIRVLL